MKKGAVGKEKALAYSFRMRVEAKNGFTRLTPVMLYSPPPLRHVRCRASAAPKPPRSFSHSISSRFSASFSAAVSLCLSRV